MPSTPDTFGTRTLPPADPTPTATVTPTPASSTVPPKGTKLSSGGGDVLAKCTGSGKSRLVSWQPKTGWTVSSVSAGPAATGIVFTNGTGTTRMTVTCLAGIPTAVVLPL